MMMLNIRSDSGDMNLDIALEDTAYGDFVGRKVGEDEWYEQVADFKHWYNTMYNPLEPV